MYFKKLIGEKCYLSPICLEDAEIYTRWINDMETSIGLTLSNTLLTVERERELLESLQKEPYNFAIINKVNDQLLGNTGLMNLDYINRRAEIGIFIGEAENLGKGIGQEAMNLVLDFAFNILNLNSVYLRVFEFNRIARGCYEKVGFKEAGRFREAKIVCGKTYDEILMDILAKEFTSPYIEKFVDRKNRKK